MCPSSSRLGPTAPTVAANPSPTADATALASTVMTRCDVLAECTEEPGRITRRYATPALAAAQDLVAGWMREAGLATRRDAVGNLIGRWDGDAPGAPAVLLGGHLDTVRDAGRYDGTLGVLTGLAVVERLRARGPRLPVPIEVVAFADEEGLRFHTSYLGSRGFLGALDPATLARMDETGLSVEQAIREAGGDPERAASGLSPGPYRAFIEAHIEQGPVLEARGLPVGVVSAIAGQTRATLTFSGEAGHAGTVPMALRRDALCAAAEFVLIAEQTARQTNGLVATIGQLALEPGAGNVIPGRVTHSLDVRHADDTIRRRAVAELLEQAKAIAERRQVELAVDVAGDNKAVACDEALTDVLASAIADAGWEVARLVSGAGHDAAALSVAMPVAMLFVRCERGISHNPAESVQAEDVAVAIDVLTRAVERLAETSG